MTEETAIKEKEVELSKDAKKILDSVEKMTVLELSQLVKALEDKFGVVAAAPVVAGAAPVAAGSAESDESENKKDTVDLILKSAGDKKIQVLKVVREITGLGLKEAKELVDSAPKVVKEALGKGEADELKKKLEEQGAEIELK